MTPQQEEGGVNPATEAITLPELARLSQIEYRTAHVWMKRGLLTPSIRSTEGQGHPNLFSTDDVEHAKNLRVLRRWLTVDGLAAVTTDHDERDNLQTMLALL